MENEERCLFLFFTVHPDYTALIGLLDWLMVSHIEVLLKPLENHQLNFHYYQNFILGVRLRLIGSHCFLRMCPKLLVQIMMRCGHRDMFRTIFSICLWCSKYVVCISQLDIGQLLHSHHIVLAICCLAFFSSSQKLILEVHDGSETAADPSILSFMKVQNTKLLKLCVVLIKDLPNF